MRMRLIRGFFPLKRGANQLECAGKQIRCSLQEFGLLCCICRFFGGGNGEGGIRAIGTKRGDYAKRKKLYAPVEIPRARCPAESADVSANGSQEKGVSD
jgi:hypothetical protein